MATKPHAHEQDVEGAPDSSAPAHGPHTRTGEVAAHAISRSLATVKHRLRLATEKAAEDVEHVHALRVSVRRAMAALALYDELLPRRAARWMARALREIRRAADRARDLDVLLQRLLSDPDGARAHALLEAMHEQRRLAQEPIATAFRRVQRERFGRATKALRRGAMRARGPAKLRLGAFMRGALAPIEERFFAAASGALGTIGALHALRIRAKEVRYAMELAAPAFPGPELAPRVKSALHALQDRLGEINDHAKALEALGDALTWSESDAVLMAKLLEAEAGSLAGAVSALREWWSSDRGRELESAFAELHADEQEPDMATQLH
jgi:CHAD domain-containing protein